MNYSNLIRGFPLIVVSTLMILVGPAAAQQNPKTSINRNPNGAILIELSDQWGAYATRGHAQKVCYAMSKPIERKPEHLNRDPGFIFISSRPGEKVWEEVAFAVGFPVKKGSDPVLQIGNETFHMVSDGSNVWAKSPDDQARVVAAMKRGATMSIEAVSQRGNKSTDIYSLKGVSKALDLARKSCR